MTVTELANRSEISPATVRYYTRIGLLKPARHSGNGYKLYTDSDIKRLRFVRQAQSLGYTLAEIAEILHHARRGESPCQKVRDVIQKRIKETKQKVRELTLLQRRMEKALLQWEKMPNLKRRKIARRLWKER